MAVQWYTDDRQIQITFPYNLGSFTKGDGNIKRLWLYNSGPDSLISAKLMIELIPGSPVTAWQIAKDYNGRPQVFFDYLIPMAFTSIPAYSWTLLWIKFNPDMADEIDNPNSINLRLTAETQA